MTSNRLPAPFCRNSRYPSDFSAFTLIEILIVIILLGVAAGLAVPNFSSSYEKFLLSETVKDLSFFMRYAQDRAVIKSKTHRIVLDGQNQKYWLEEAEEKTGEGSAGGRFAAIGGRFGRVFKVPEGIALETLQSHIIFYPDGRIDKARVYLCDKKKNCFTLSTFEQDGYVQTFDFKLE